jgi:hypothetical protein
MIHKIKLNCNKIYSEPSTGATGEEPILLNTTSATPYAIKRKTKTEPEHTRGIETRARIRAYENGPFQPPKNGHETEVFINMSE